MKKKLIVLAVCIVGILLLFVGYFYSIKYLDSKVLESTESIPIEEKYEGTAFIIPSYFIDGERFYIKLPIVGGDTILAFGDTGGGLSMLMPGAEKNEQINSKLRTALCKGIMPMQYILFSDLVSDNRFPKPYPMRNFVLRNPFMRVSNPYLLIPPMESELKFMMEAQPEMEAFLGQAFFMNKSWTIDYPNQEIRVNTPLSDTQLSYPNVQEVGFKKNLNKENIFGHPSMKIEVDGDTIDVLFDTGATIVLSEDGKKQMKTEKKTIGGSFIAISIFNKWRAKHPEWKYYPKSDMAGDLIEVPIVNIGGYEVGPVLFASRPDENWSKGMITSMDKVVKGAIGGSGLKYLKVTIDYNSELIKFDSEFKK